MFDFSKWTEILSQMAKKPELAPTPSEIIYRDNKLRLLRYPPATGATRPTPILIVTSLINKYYILDLMPGKSYVEYLVNQGFAVYMTDWAVPDYSDRDQYRVAEVG